MGTCVSYQVEESTSGALTPDLRQFPLVAVRGLRSQNYQKVIGSLRSRLIQFDFDPVEFRGSEIVSFLTNRELPYTIIYITLWLSIGLIFSGKFDLLKTGT